MAGIIEPIAKIRLGTNNKTSIRLKFGKIFKISKS